jgi:HAD superfamily hydrolase (TIGR01459 family)
MPVPMPDISRIDHIAPLAPTADVWFVDIWGVLHNGVRPYEAAVAACLAFRRSGGVVVLLSNSPRPCDGVIRQLDDIGVAREAYDHAVTSGDVSRGLIGGFAGRTAWHLGPERDRAIFLGIDIILGAPAEADVIVCTGLFDDERETAGDYTERLAPLARRQVPMVCVNPDLTVERGGRIIPCAGALAACYAKLGGVVSFAGKPHAPIYDAGFAWITDHLGRPPEQDRVLAIGDGAGTDIAGAVAYGIRCVFVASKVSVADGETLPGAARRLFPEPGRQPVAVMPALAW